MSKYFKGTNIRFNSVSLGGILNDQPKTFLEGYKKYCLEKGIEAKVHYPIPMYLQKALNFMNHREGDFPITDKHSKKIITFPCDQHLTRQEIEYVIQTVTNFYQN